MNLDGFQVPKRDNLTNKVEKTGSRQTRLAVRTLLLDCITMRGGWGLFVGWFGDGLGMVWGWFGHSLR